MTARMSLSRVCFAALVVLLVGCSEDVTGHWCGTRVTKDEHCAGDDVGYLLLDQQSNQIDGQACEAFEHDCYILEDGKLEGGYVTFRYTFREGSVNAKLSVLDDSLAGVYFASKCDCNVPFRFYRIE